MSWNQTNSPFASKLGTNQSITAQELSRLKDALLEPRHVLDCLTSDIARVQARLDDLLSQQKNVQEYISAHEALSSPIRRIPTETLSEIFMQCLPEGPYAIRSLKYAPLLITTVCKDWRHIAVNNPALWSSLHIHFSPHLSASAAQQRVDGVTLWLERSRMLPISLSFHGSGASNYLHPYIGPGVLGPTSPGAPSHAQGQANLSLILRSLLHHSDRIRHISLALPSHELDTFNTLSPSVFPVLESLRLEEYDKTFFNVLSPSSAGMAVPSTFETLLSRLPCLKSLEMNTRDGGILLCLLPCRWAFLTNLSVRASLYPAKLLGILTATPLLQSLQACVLIAPSPPQEPPFDDSTLPFASLPSLITLSLSFSSETSPMHPAFLLPNMNDPNGNSLKKITAVCTRIVTQSLKTLLFSWRKGFLPLVPFSAMLEPVEYLGIEVAMSHEVFRECLSLVPNLISLDFVDMGDLTQESNYSTLRDTTLAQLTPVANDLSELCPRLQQFRMTDASALGFPGPTGNRLRVKWSAIALTNFIWARTNTKTLTVCDILLRDTRLFSNREQDRLRKLKQDGLKIRLHEPKSYLPLALPPDTPMQGLIPAAKQASLLQMQKRTYLTDMACNFDTQVII